MSVLQPGPRGCLLRVGLAVFAFLGATASRAAADAGLTVLRGVTLVDPAAGVPRADMVLELAGDRIRRALPAAGYSTPAGARVLDLPGRYVTPGFIDMHVHLLLHPWDAEGHITPQYDRAAVVKILRLLLAHGVTTVRDPGSPTEAAVQFRQLVRTGALLGPNIVTAGRILNASDFPVEPFVRVENPAAVREEIRWQARVGVDLIKIYSSLGPELTRVAITEAHALGLPVIGHLQRTTWTEAAELGIDGLCHGAPWSPVYLAPADRPGYPQTLAGRAYWLEHIDLAGPALRQMITTLAERRVPLDPTLIALHTKFFGDQPRWRAHPRLGLMPESHRRGWPRGSFTSSWSAADYARAQAAWPRQLALTRALHQGGVPLVVGTDTPGPWIIPGVSLHEELGLLGEAGIPPRELLRMATVNAARALRREREIGGLEPGMRADLVVLRGDPLADIANAARIEHVALGGVLYRPEELLGEEGTSAPAK